MHRAAGCLIANNWTGQDGYEISFWWLNISSQFRTCTWMMWRKSTPAAFTLWHFPSEEDLPGRLQKTQKHLLSPARCCMAVSWHGAGKQLCLCRVPHPYHGCQPHFSLSVVISTPPSSSKYLTAPSHVIIKATIAMRSYGCRRIFLPRPCFHFLTNICILSQNFPRLLYAWGTILFCFFESLIKCHTARFLEKGDEKKKDVAFFL